MDASLIHIPSLDECRKLFDTYEMLPNIRQHSEMVMQVTTLITDHLLPTCPVQKDLCIAAAMLHDITKTASFTTREPHAESAGRLLHAIGYPEIADIVAQHVQLRDFSPTSRLSEAEIVYYADKRVKHHECVSIEERIIDLLERYGTSDTQRQRILRIKDILIDIESKLEQCLDMPIDDILDSL